MITNLIEIIGSLKMTENITGKLSAAEKISGRINIPEIVRPAAYDGSYHIIPGQEAQMLDTRGYMMDDDMVIEPIPQNYGLITWNGTTLTVS